MNYQFGFIGCGNMGGALALAVASIAKKGSVAVCDTDPQKAQTLAARIGADVLSLEALANNADYLFLGVKPQGFDGLFEVLRPILQKRASRVVLITMAAGLSISHVEALAQTKLPIIRIMPSTPVSVGEGMILYTKNQEVQEEEAQIFLNALANAGCLDEIEESKIDAASALSGCGPAFVYLFAEALADGAVECGLSRDKANLYAAQTILGAGKLLLESGKHPGELKDAVCSPGGTTIAGVHALESGAFRASSIEAVVAAYQKTLQLKK